MMKQNNKSLLLTSDGLTTPAIVKKVTEYTPRITQKNVAIVTTASRNKENNPYSTRAYDQYLDIGFHNAQFVDLETEPHFDFSTYDAIHVCGGNTFKLLHFARLTDFQTSIEKLFERGGIYIGVSAGTIIVTPSIQFVSDFNLDPNNIGMTDFEGFNIVPHHIFVHYATEWEDKVRKYEKENNISFVRLSNEQSLLVEQNTTQFI